MAGRRCFLHLVFACTEEQQSTILRLLTDSQFEERNSSCWIGDSNLFPGVLDHGPVSEIRQVKVAIRSYECFEGAIIETWSANASGDSNVYEKGRIEASAMFESIEGLDELRS